MIQPDYRVEHCDTAIDVNGRFVYRSANEKQGPNLAAFKLRFDSQMAGCEGAAYPDAVSISGFGPPNTYRQTGIDRVPLSHDTVEVVYYGWSTALLVMYTHGCGVVGFVPHYNAPVFLLRYSQNGVNAETGELAIALARKWGIPPGGRY